MMIFFPSRALIELSLMCQVCAKRYMGANSWNLCSDTEGPSKHALAGVGGGCWSPERRCHLCWVGGTGGEGKSPGLRYRAPTLGSRFSQLCTILIGQLRRRRGGETEQLPRASRPVSAELGLEPSPWDHKCRALSARTTPGQGGGWSSPVTDQQLRTPSQSLQTHFSLPGVSHVAP